MLRAIHIFPEFSNERSIDTLRAEYDPLYGLIQPHVTLVFPFESTLTTESLQQHLQESVIGLKPFSIVLKGVTGAEEEYLFLNVKVGNDQIIELHDRLYAGLLQRYLNRSRTYTPHVTVGRLDDKQTFEYAVSETQYMSEIFKTTVHEFVVETIDDSGKSTIELKIRL